MEAGDHPGGHVDGQSQPGPTQRPAVGLGDDDHIGQGVVDLDQPERLILREAPDDAAQLAAGIGRTAPSPKDLPLVAGLEARRNRLAARCCEALLGTAPSDLEHEGGDRWTLPVQIESLTAELTMSSISALSMRTPEALPRVRGRMAVTVGSARSRRSNR